MCLTTTKLPNLALIAIPASEIRNLYGMDLLNKPIFAILNITCNTKVIETAL